MTVQSHSRVTPDSSLMGTQGSSLPQGPTSNNQEDTQASSLLLGHMGSLSPVDTKGRVTLARPLLVWTPT